MGYFGGTRALEIHLQDGFRLTSKSQVFNAILAPRHGHTDDNNAHNDDDDGSNNRHQDIEIQPLWPPIRQPGNVTVRDRWWQRGCKQHNDIMPLSVYSVSTDLDKGKLELDMEGSVQPSVPKALGRQRST